MCAIVAARSRSYAVVAMARWWADARPTAQSPPPRLRMLIRTQVQALTDLAGAAGRPARPSPVDAVPLGRLQKGAGQRHMRVQNHQGLVLVPQPARRSHLA